MENQDGITLTDLFHMLVRNIFLIAGVTFLITVIGIIYTTKFVKPKYQSSNDILIQVSKDVETKSPNDIDLTSTLRLIETVSQYLEKSIVIKDAINSLGLDLTYDEVKDNLDITYSTQSLFVTIKYTTTDKGLAKDMVDAIIASAIKIASERFPIIEGTMYPVGEATDAKYVSPNVLLNTIISFFLGGVLGVVLALVLEALKTTVRNKKELEELIPRYQVIGVIPEIKKHER